MKIARACTRSLRNYLVRVLRDVERNCQSVYAPEVECISKGNVHNKYEFGCKVDVAATSRGDWFVGAKALHGNPDDGHTLK